MVNMTQRPEGTRANRLLAALSPAAYGRIAPHLVPAQLTLGQVLQESGATIRNVYFPTTAIA